MSNLEMVAARDRWRGVAEGLRNDLYQIARTPPEKIIEKSVGAVIKEIKNYSGILRDRLSYELEGAINAHEKGDPGSYIRS